MAEKIYIDIACGLARVGGNEGLYRRRLGKFESSVDIPGIDKAISAGNYSVAVEFVHEARCAAGNLALPSFSESCTVLMEELRSGKAPNEESLASFKRLFEETKTAVTDYLNE